MAKTPKYNYTDPMFLLEVEGYARDGYDDQQIAEILDLTPGAFCKIKKKTEPLEQALKRGRRPLEVLVENSLYKRATGMKVKTTVTKYMQLPDGTITDTEIVSVTETELPPDTGAAMAWLKHRKPELWNNQPNKVDMTTDGKPIEQPEITKIEIVRGVVYNPEESKAASNDTEL